LDSKEMRRALVAALALVVAGGSGAEPADPPPAIVALVLDTSGSLRPEDLERTRTLAQQLLEALPARSEVAVLTFDDQSRVVVERTADPEPVRAAILSVHASGRFTALHDALYDAGRYLRDAPPARKAIVLVTDGRDENSALNLDDGLAVATASGIPVHAIGLGRVEERTLRRIAKLTGGEYLAIGDAGAAELAARIVSLPEPTPPPPASTLAEVSTPEPAASPATPPARWRGALWLLLLAAVLAAGLLLLAAISRRADPRAPAVVPARGDGPATKTPAEPATDGTAEDEDPAYSPTMVGPMPTPEEYLDKTITLSELPVLVVQGGPQSGQFHVLMQNTTTCLGRAKANDIVLDDVSVSGQHCRIRWEDGHYVLHDLKSTNGSFVNEQRVTRHVLKPGDVLKLGETYVQFKLDRKKA
jgi:uncharacterized protein YegL